MPIQNIPLDEQILRELCDQQQYWKQQVEDAKKRVLDASEQLAKVNRLINVFHNRIDKLY